MSPVRGGPGSRRARAGFGLLEAIVALALLAGTGLTLFAWIHQNLQAASRLRAHELEARLLSSAQALIDTVNPLEAPTGSLDLGSVSLRWRAVALEPVRRNATFTDGVEGPWLVGLYRLDVQARDSALDVERRFEQWVVGTRRLQPADELFK